MAKMARAPSLFCTTTEGNCNYFAHSELAKVYSALQLHICCRVNDLFVYLQAFQNWSWSSLGMFLGRSIYISGSKNATCIVKEIQAK